MQQIPRQVPCNTTQTCCSAAKSGLAPLAGVIAASDHFLLSAATGVAPQPTSGSGLCWQPERCAIRQCMSSTALDASSMPWLCHICFFKHCKGLAKAAAEDTAKQATKQAHNMQPWSRCVISAEASLLFSLFHAVHTQYLHEGYTRFVETCLHYHARTTLQDDVLHQTPVAWCRHAELAQTSPCSHQPDLRDILCGAPALHTMLFRPERAGLSECSS